MEEATGNRVKDQMGRTAYRPLGVLYLSICVRAAHQVGAALFLAFFLLDLGPVGDSGSYLMFASISGIALCCTEALRHRQMYREVSGMVTMAKCLLLGLAFHQAIPSVIGVLAAFCLASLGAHAPKNIRHRLIL